MLRSSFVIALLIASFVANATLFLFPYDWSRDNPGHPPYGVNQNAAKQGANGQAQSQELNSESFWVRTTSDPIAFFTAALFAATLVLSVVAIIQIYFLTRADKTAGISANSSKHSAEISRISMVSGDRAYVHHGGMRWISHTESGTDRVFWRIRPQWINSGNTPTRQLRIVVRYYFEDHPLSDNFDFSIPDSEFANPALISPKGLIESGPYELFGDQIVEVAEGKKHFYVYGIAKYRDVFPDTPPRITKFCVYVDNISGDVRKEWADKTNMVEMRFAGYPRHNCADEDCD